MQLLWSFKCFCMSCINYIYIYMHACTLQPWAPIFIVWDLLIRSLVIDNQSKLMNIILLPLTILLWKGWGTIQLTSVISFFIKFNHIHAHYQYRLSCMFLNTYDWVCVTIRQSPHIISHKEHNMHEQQGHIN